MRDGLIVNDEIRNFQMMAWSMELIDHVIICDEEIITVAELGPCHFSTETD